MAALIAATRVLENDRGQGLGKGADYPGAVLVTAALMLGVHTIVKAADHGWAAPAPSGSAESPYCCSRPSPYGSRTRPIPCCGHGCCAPGPWWARISSSF